MATVLSLDGSIEKYLPYLVKSWESISILGNSQYPYGSYCGDQTPDVVSVNYETFYIIDPLTKSVYLSINNRISW